MDIKKRRYNGEEVLEALFVLPSDVEQSGDEFEVDEVNNRNSNTASSGDVECTSTIDVYHDTCESDVDSIVSTGSSTFIF